MKGTRRIIPALTVVLITCAMLAGWYPAQGTSTQASVAVVDFANSSGLGLYAIEQTSNELLSVLLSKEGFKVVERDKLNTVLREQRLSITQLVDSASHMIQVGRLAGADFIITGSVANLSVEVEQGTQTAVMTLSVKLLNVSTAEVILADLFESTLPVSFLSAHPAYLNSGQVRNLLRAALEAAVASVSQRVKAAMTAATPPASCSLAWRGKPLQVTADEAKNQLLLQYAGRQVTVVFPFDVTLPEQPGQSPVVDYGALLDRELGSYTYQGVEYSVIEELRRHLVEVTAPTKEQLEATLAAELNLWASALSDYVPFITENGSYYGELSAATGRPRTVYVQGYFRRDGTYVRSHYRSR